jgi:hypothetical protein
MGCLLKSWQGILGICCDFSLGFPYFWGALLARSMFIFRTSGDGIWIAWPCAGTSASERPTQLLALNCAARTFRRNLNV